MGNWWITLLLHAVISIVFIGMKNIAIAMADPFGATTHVENKRPFGRAIGARAADWPRMADAWGCPGLDSAAARACRSQRSIWPK